MPTVIENFFSVNNFRISHLELVKGCGLALWFMGHYTQYKAAIKDVLSFNSHNLVLKNSLNSEWKFIYYLEQI
jgi:hypothetical protein